MAAQDQALRTDSVNILLTIKMFPRGRHAECVEEE